MFDPVSEGDVLAHLLPLLYYVFPDMFEDPVQVIMFLVELIQASQGSAE